MRTLLFVLIASCGFCATTDTITTPVVGLKSIGRTDAAKSFKKLKKGSPDSWRMSEAPADANRFYSYLVRTYGLNSAATQEMLRTMKITNKPEYEYEMLRTAAINKDLPRARAWHARVLDRPEDSSEPVHAYADVFLMTTLWETNHLTEAREMAERMMNNAKYEKWRKTCYHVLKRSPR